MDKQTVLIDVRYAQGQLRLALSPTSSANPFDAVRRAMDALERIEQYAEDAEAEGAEFCPLCGLTHADGNGTIGYSCEKGR